MACLVFLWARSGLNGNVIVHACGWPISLFLAYPLASPQVAMVTSSMVSCGAGLLKHFYFGLWCSLQAAFGPPDPSQIFQFLGEGILLFIVLWRYVRKPCALGAVSGVFMMGYCSLRSMAEYFREPDAQLGLWALGMSMGQWHVYQWKPEVFHDGFIQIRNFQKWLIN